MGVRAGCGDSHSKGDTENLEGKGNRGRTNGATRGPLLHLWLNFAEWIKGCHGLTQLLPLGHTPHD